MRIVAPASPVIDRSLITRGLRALEGLGLRCEFGGHAGDRWGYLAGRDEDRAEDLLAALEDPQVDAVVCLRGGYGSLRTALRLDLRRVAALAERPPKVFLGYSDITVLHAILGRYADWVSFYGPMVVSLADASPYTVDGMRAALMSTEPFAVSPDPDDSYVETLVPGRAEGVLEGGCLQLLAALVGTPWQPDFAGKVVFFEDVHSEPYQVDRELAQLRASGALDGCAGIVIGEHVDAQPRLIGHSLGLLDVFYDHLAGLGIPVFYPLPLGHGRHLATLPLGVPVSIDAEKGTLRTTQGAVC